MVYVKTVDLYGNWIHQTSYDRARHDLQGILNEIEQWEMAAGFPGIKNLEKEILQYHHDYDSVSKADFVLLHPNDRIR